MRRKHFEDLREVWGIERDINELMRKSSLRWDGLDMRREEGADIKRILEFEVDGR